MEDSKYLDDAKTYETYDTLNMREHLQAFVRISKESWDNAGKVSLPASYKNANHIVILGMGGSAIGGDLVAGILLDECKVPISIFRNYDLPAFVDENTLVIASSYSGNTEECISAFGQALESKAMKLAISHGGVIEEMAHNNNIPHIKIDYVSPPRAAMPTNMMSILRVINDLGYIKDKSIEFAETINELNEYSKELEPTVPTKDNYAKQLAISLKGKPVVIYGAEYLHEVAHRWKSQINENAKNWSFYAEIPEVDHIDISEYPNPTIFKRIVEVVILKSDMIHKRNQLRCEVTSKILNEEEISWRFVDIKGKSKLSGMLKAILLGDYLSLYLALFNHIEPASTEVITKLKQEMAKYN